MTYESHIPNAAAIYHAVYEETGVTPEEIMSKRRTARISNARHMVIAMLHIQFPSWSYPDLADAVKRKDHGTAMYAVKRIRILVETKPAYKAAMQRVMARYKKNLDEKLSLPIAVK
jgi:chromosomal replication initiation ATPase DnaA